MQTAMLVFGLEKLLQTKSVVRSTDYDHVQLTTKAEGI